MTNEEVMLRRKVTLVLKGIRGLVRYAETLDPVEQAAAVADVLQRLEDSVETMRSTLQTLQTATFAPVISTSPEVK